MSRHVYFTIRTLQFEPTCTLLRVAGMSNVTPSKPRFLRPRRRMLIPLPETSHRMPVFSPSIRHRTQNTHTRHIRNCRSGGVCPPCDAFPTEYCTAHAPLHPSTLEIRLRRLCGGSSLETADHLSSGQEAYVGLVGGILPAHDTTQRLPKRHLRKAKGIQVLLIYFRWVISYSGPIAGYLPSVMRACMQLGSNSIPR
jgi:hypothetical protein